MGASLAGTWLGRDQDLDSGGLSRPQVNIGFVGSPKKLFFRHRDKNLIPLRCGAVRGLHGAGIWHKGPSVDQDRSISLAGGLDSCREAKNARKYDPSGGH